MEILEACDDSFFGVGVMHKYKNDEEGLLQILTFVAGWTPEDDLDTSLAWVF